MKSSNRCANFLRNVWEIQQSTYFCSTFLYWFPTRLQIFEPCKLFVIDNIVGDIQK